MNKTIAIPEKWSDIKYKDYYKFITAIDGQEDNSQLTLEILLQYLCNINTVDYYNLPKKTFEEVTELLTNLLTNSSNEPLVMSFVANNVEYRLEPDMENMHYGMYLDLSTYSKDIWKNLPIICSILYRPVESKVGNMYTIKPYKGTNSDTIDMFKELLTMDICHGVIGFFLTLQKDLLMSSLLSTVKDMSQMLTTHQVQTFKESGVDIQALLHSAEETLPNLMK